MRSQLGLAWEKQLKLEHTLQCYILHVLLKVVSTVGKGKLMRGQLNFGTYNKGKRGETNLYAI